MGLSLARIYRAHIEFGVRLILFLGIPCVPHRHSWLISTAEVDKPDLHSSRPFCLGLYANALMACCAKHSCHILVILSTSARNENRRVSRLSSSSTPVQAQCGSSGPSHSQPLPHRLVCQRLFVCTRCKFTFMSSCSPSNRGAKTNSCCPYHVLIRLYLLHGRQH